MRKLKEKTAKKEGLEKSSDAYIEALIYHSMGKSDATWNAISEVTKGLKNLRYQKDKYQALKDNIQIRYRGYGWEHWKTPWSSGGRKLTIPDLTLRLKDLIKGEKKLKTRIPEKPKEPTPKRTETVQLGTATKQREILDQKAMENDEEFDYSAKET